MLRRYFSIFAVLSLLTLTGASCVSTGGAVSGPMGMYRSPDKGENWQPIVSFPSTQGVMSISGVKVFRYYSDPSDHNAIYLTTRGQGLYYSYNNGDSWQTVPALAGSFLYGLAVDPKDKCNIYVADASRIYKTEDCSRTWKTMYIEQRLGERFSSVVIDSKDNKIIYAAQLNGDVLVSRDYGKSWAVLNRFGKYLQYLVADPLVPGRLYLATYRDGLMRSDDQGKNWIELGDGLTSFSGGKDFYRLILNPGQKDSLFWIAKYGILRSDNAGKTWSAMNLITPPGSVNIYAFAINPQNQKEIYYTGTILGEKNTNIRSTFYKTTDSGVSWVTKKMPTNTIPALMFLHPDDPKTLFMGFTTFQ